MQNNQHQGTGGQQGRRETTDQDRQETGAESPHLNPFRNAPNPGENETGTEDASAEQQRKEALTERD